MKPYNIKSIRWLSGIILVVIFAQLTAFAQTTQQEEVVNSPGSVLHERTKKVADSILAALGVDIRFIVSPYNQVTNLTQLSGITSLDLFNEGLTNLQAADFNGLTNLQGLRLSTNQLTSLPSGIFDELGNLQTLSLSGNQLTTLPAGIFDKLASLQSLDISNNPLGVLPSEIFDKLPPEMSMRMKNLYDKHFRSISLALLSPSRITEGDANVPNAVVQVRLSQAASVPVTVIYVPISEAPPGSITPDAQLKGDYDSTRGTLTFPAGTTNLTQTISIPILDDNIAEPAEESFALILGTTDAVFLHDGNQRQRFLDDGERLLYTYFTIIDDDGAPTLSISLAPWRSIPDPNDEGGRLQYIAPFQVLLSRPSQETVTVTYATRDGTAKAGEDYERRVSALTFRRGTTIQTGVIPILADTVDEPDETFTIELVNPVNAVFANNANTLTATITIKEDNPANNNQPGVSSGLAPAGRSLPSLVFSRTRLSLSESGSATYQVRATSSQNRNMIVNIQTAHPGVTVTPSKLMFNQNNWQTYQTVTVTASADAADTNEQASIRHSIPASEGFTAINDAGVVSITLAHTILEEPNGKDIVEPEEPVAPEPPTNSEPVDYDQDDDGLIEISNLTQLNAIRWDLNGDGQPDKETFAKAYNQAFPSAIANMGIPNNAQAQGYELTTNLHFDSHKNNRADEADPFWNPGNGWQSIGVFANPFQAILEGNGYVISSLFQDQSDAALFYEKPSGLFGAIGNRGQVVNLALEGVHIQGITWVGGLAGLNQGLIRNCSVRGRVAGMNSVGGLVGHNFGHIADSHVHAAVLGNIGVGGLVGWNAGGLIEGSTAPGQEGQEEALGLVGFGTPAR